MEIIRGKPVARGVTELQYVGDDGAVEAATGNQLARLLFGVSAVLMLLPAAPNKKAWAARGAAAYFAYRAVTG